MGISWRTRNKIANDPRSDQWPCCMCENWLKYDGYFASGEIELRFKYFTVWAAFWVNYLERPSHVNMYGQNIRKDDWLNGVLHCLLQDFSHITRWQLTLFVSFLCVTSTRMGLWIFLTKDTPRENPGHPARLEPRALDYESSTLPLSHEGPRKDQ